MKKTKILATFGPAVDSPATVRALVEAGVNAFRVNCSHGDAASFKHAVGVIRRGLTRCRYPVGLLFDISGPKLRLDRFDGELRVPAGGKITLAAVGTDVRQRKIAANHPEIIKALRKGQMVLIDDGRLAFEVMEANRVSAVLRAVEGGTLTAGKGINLPNSSIPLPTITAKDRRDIKTAIALEADYLALSFVRSPLDIVEARRLVRRYGGTQKIIAKLEKREAIDALAEIMELADGVMIARGDLGVELPPAELPRLQKEIIALSNRLRKPVIVATQMLESMRFSPRATRAEVNDVASAVFDFADAVMLSAETATGEYPLQSVNVMRAVIEATEPAGRRPTSYRSRVEDQPPIPLAVAEMISRAPYPKSVKVIFAFTTSGFTAEMLSNAYPLQPVIALTTDHRVMRRLSLFRSVYGVHIKHPRSFDDMIHTVNKLCKSHDLARPGDLAIITGGAAFGATAPTNLLMFHEVR